MAGRITLNGTFLSTLPAWGATVKARRAVREPSKISIHAPRVGSDTNRQLPTDELKKFLSTLPAWGATMLAVISIVAWPNFYPRSPRGERPAGVFLVTLII